MNLMHQLFPFDFKKMPVFHEKLGYSHDDCV
jgi:hypothetical protein